MPELDEKNVLQFGQSSSNRVYQLQKELDNTKAKLRAANRLIYQLYEWRNQRTKIFKASTKDSVWKYVEEWVGNATNRKVVREKP